MTPTIHEFVLAMGSSLPASIVAKATVIAAFGLVGARLARRSRAAVRHVLLAATFGVLLLLPVASLIVPPVRIAVPTVNMGNAKLLAPGAGSEWILPFTAGEAHPAVALTASRSSWPPVSMLVFMGWLAGVTLALVPMIASLWKIRCLRRSGLPWADGRKVVDKLWLESDSRRRVEVLLHEELPGPIASGMLHPTILFPPDAQAWATEDLNRALVHELEHLRRGDVVTHCLARAICAVYWFHPLVWMAWRQLILEAERSCDDAVIARSEATAYADQLVGLARRLLTAAKSPLLGMASRADLAIRVGAVLDGRQRRGRAGLFVLALGCAAAVVLVLTISPLRTVSAPQSASPQTASTSSPATAAGAPLPSFEVASIKPNRSPDGNMQGLYPPGRVSFRYTTMKRLIAFAYYVKPFQISGRPSWVSSDKWDIDAKEPDALAEQRRDLSVIQQRQKVGLLVQSLLTDRFRLHVTHEVRELPIYVLVVAKGGPKLRAAKSGDTYPNGLKADNGQPIGHGDNFWLGRGSLIAQGIPFQTLVDVLSFHLGRTIVNQSGLKGKYDFNLHWTPDENPAVAASLGGDPNGTGGPAADISGPSIFTAIQEQLGLKLESTKGPVEVLVIDHIERPSEN